LKNISDDKIFKLLFNKILLNEIKQFEKKIKMLCEKLITITNFYNYLYFNTFKDHITLEIDRITGEEIYDCDIDFINDLEDNKKRDVLNYDMKIIKEKLEEKIHNKQKNFKEFNKIILDLWKNLIESIKKDKEISVSEKSSKSIKISSSKSGGTNSEELWTSSSLSSSTNSIQNIIDKFIKKIIDNYDTGYVNFYIIKSKKIKETNINLNKPLVINNSSVILNNLLITSIVNDEEIIKYLNNNKIIELQEINRLIQTYNKTLNKELLIENNEKINKIFKDAFDTNLNINEDIINVTNHSIISLFARFIKFKGDLKFNDYIITNNITRYNFYYVINKIFNDNNLEQLSGIDHGGLRREFITNLTTELFSKNIFITQPNNTEKYFLNPEYRLDEKDIIVIKHISNVDFRNDKLNHWKIFYTFLAKLISFILVNDCGLEHKLSLGLITHIIKEKEEIKDEDYLYFLLDDFPELAKGLYNVKEDEIEYIDLTYNDTYYLNKNNLPIKNEDDYKDYLIKTSKFVTTKMILRKEIEYKYNDKDKTEKNYNKLSKYGEFIFNSFIDGIPKEIKTIFKNIPIKSVETYLTPSRLSLETIQLLIKNLKTNTINTIDKLSDDIKKQALQNTLDIFINKILLNSREKKLDEYLDYIEKLLRFWSGSSIYKNNEKYRIEINFDETLSLKALPVSHTCYFQIDFPNYINTAKETKEEILIKKMDLAINYVEVGIGMAGGSKVNNNNNNKKRKMKTYM